MKPSIPKGTRDFSPTEVARRTYIMNTIKTSFETFGFQPIETPSFEKSSTLMGKYGEEGDRLIFRVLDSADFYNRNVFGGKTEESLSVYISLTYIFKNTVKHILHIIKEMNQEFLTLEEFQSFIKNGEILRSLDSTIDEFVSLNTEENDDRIAILKVLKEEKARIIIECLKLIRSKGLDFHQKIKDKNFLEWQLKWSDRRVVKELSLDLYNKIITVSSNLEKFSSTKLASQISEKALRYDLTVPFARYVVQHQNEITFPFKRYQVQPVWRADKPQKGRFREFYQCDADVVGSKSLWQEVEFIQLYDTVFTQLGLVETTIKMNNRKILSGIAEVIGAQDKLIDFTVALDKLDKIGQEKVEAEMLSKGISEEAIKKVQPLFSFNGTNEENLDALANMLQTSDEGLKGVEELRFVINSVNALGLQSANLEIDVTLARGLNYYTGAIFEVAAPKGIKMGSIGGGGRYDDLTSLFDIREPLSGVGISFGLDRIYIVLEELGLFKTVDLPKPKVLFINFGEAEGLYCMKAIMQLRANGVKSELYPDAAKMKKQMNYANKREIEFVVIVGSQEIENNEFTLKNMVSGEQTKCSLSELISQVK